MKILMVCLGNICRSPMAEGIMRRKVEERGLNIEVDSAGTSHYHIGEGPDERAVRCMKRKGIDITGLRARQLTPSDLASFDLVFAMDRVNRVNTADLAADHEQKAKVKLMLDVLDPGGGMEVPDPYFGGDAGFEHVYTLLDKACDAILDELNA